MSREVRKARQESVDIAEAWLALYRELHDKLLELAAQRQPADAVLRARPVEGEIDYAEMSREHIARYPKIRARLAE
jgi:acyl carrier protein phosphodiesterase